MTVKVDNIKDFHSKEIKQLSISGPEAKWNSEMADLWCFQMRDIIPDVFNRTQSLD